ncbi:MAG: hypothetical protein L2C94_002410 [Aigarchaeota archaeon]|nr:hypothetical protein [Candidatus Wolframiiraptor gerlachensis]
MKPKELEMCEKDRPVFKRWAVWLIIVYLSLMSRAEGFNNASWQEMGYVEVISRKIP